MARPRTRGVLVATLALFLLAEAGVRVGRSVQGLAPPSLDAGTELEWQWARERLRAGGVSAGLGAWHPRLGYFTRAGLDDGTVRTNSAGFRADREFARARVPGVPRMVLVGDSYTFGYRVSNEDAWAAVLARRHLPDWEVLNLGVCGYGTDQAVLAYEEVGAAWSPDVVVLGVFVRDFMRNLVDFNGYRKPRFELDGAGGLALVDAPIPPPEELFEAYRSGALGIGTWYHSQLVTGVVADVRESFRRRAIDADSASWRLMAAILRRFRDRVTADGARPFVLVFPERLDRHLGTHWQTIDDLVVAEARALGVPALSLTAAFRAEEERRPDRPLNPSHLSVRGNEYAAELLHAALREAGLLGHDPRD